ncbi:hypothetical protein [Microbispora sp. NPDC049633]|uniref:hypothetical protein n=1 Tax=Microbispora sp. NPDC049633 TaxID=3154355 RepID=UPI0034143A3A
MTTLLHAAGRVHAFTENRPVSPMAWDLGIGVEVVERDLAVKAGIVHPAARTARPVSTR